jgi:hypothetical protein
MQIQDFLKIYREKSDEELLQLSVVRDELTSEARFALESELSRRQISVAAESSASEIDASRLPVGRAGAGQRLPGRMWQGVGGFVEEVLRTYHEHFWLFFRITLPAVVISTFAVIASRNEAREILRHLPRGIELLAYRGEILEIWLIDLCAYVVSWMAFSFSFGAICIAVEENAAGFMPSAGHCLFNVRERLGPFVRLCLLLLLFAGASVAVCELLVTPLFFVLPKWHLHPSRLVVLGISDGMVGLAFLLLSRLALSVPAIVLDDCTVWNSLFRSIELTRERWLTLAALLTKSLIGSYVAGMAPYWLVSFIQISTPLPSWFSWVLTAASIIGVTVVEPTMFVGFALLYLKMTAPDIAPSGVLASQLA